MINKNLIIAVLVLFVAMPVKAEPAKEPVQDPKAVAPVQEVSQKVKAKTVKKENKKADKIAKSKTPAQALETKAGEAVPAINDNKKTN